MSKLVSILLYVAIFLVHNQATCAERNNPEPDAAQLLLHVQEILATDNQLMNEHMQHLQEIPAQSPYPEAAVEIYEEGKQSPRSKMQANTRALKQNRKKLNKAIKKLALALNTKKPERRNSCFAYCSTSHEQQQEDS